MKLRQAARSGFTLIELLVVIAIISILAALLMPALRSALAMSRQAQCMNSQRQAVLGLLNYAEDWRGSLPANGYTATSDAWDMHVVPEYVAAQVAHCPTLAPEPYSTQGGRAYGSSIRRAMGYYNPEKMLGESANSNSLGFENKRSLSRFIVLTDSTDPTGVEERSVGFGAQSGSGWMHLRHLFRANTTFWDGHTQSLSLSEAVSGDYYAGDWNYSVHYIRMPTESAILLGD